MATSYETVALEELDLAYEALRLKQPRQEAAVLRSVERHGVLHPVVANRAANGRLVLLDGFKRLRALRQLERVEVPVREMLLDDSTARAALVTCNAPHRGLCDLEEAWIVRSLVRSCQVKQVRVAELLGRHKSWVCRRLMLAEHLDKSVQDDIRLGLLNASCARELAKLPRCNQTRVAQVVREHGLSSRQTAELVQRCRACSDDDALNELLADPLRFLVEPASPPSIEDKDPRLTKRGNEVRRKLLQLDSASSGLCQVLRRYRLDALSGPDQLVLGGMAQGIERQAKQALDWITALGQANSGGVSNA